MGFYVFNALGNIIVAALSRYRLPDAFRQEGDKAVKALHLAEGAGRAVVLIL